MGKQFNQHDLDIESRLVSIASDLRALVVRLEHIEADITEIRNSRTRFVGHVWMLAKGAALVLFGWLLRAWK